MRCNRPETGDGLETVDTEVCVPENLGAALDALENDEALVSAVGDLLVSNFIGIKRKEWDGLARRHDRLGARAVPELHLTTDAEHSGSAGAPAASGSKAHPERSKADSSGP